MTKPMLTRSAPFQASSWNQDKKTFTVGFATETPVQRRDGRGLYNEVLSLKGMRAAAPFLPLLDSHARGSLGAQIGTADNIRIAGAEAQANVRLSSTNDIAQRVATDLSEGHSFGVSCGYIVNKFKETIVNGVRTLTAVDWSLLEISLVPVPADGNAGIREIERENHMPVVEQNRAAINGEIRAIARAASLDQSFIDEMIDGERTLEEVRAAAIEQLRTRTTNAPTIRTQHNSTTLDNPEARGRAMGEAVYARVNAAHQPSDVARQYMGLTLPEMARECLRASSISTTGLSSSAVVERALHSTSDFALLLQDTTNRTLRESYRQAPSGIRPLARQKSTSDFRAVTRVQLSGASTLEKVNEHGEFKSGTMTTAKETYKIDTFGRIIGFTRQAIVNDDLGAFTDISNKLGRAAADFENQFLADLLKANPKLDDGKAVFSVEHKNIAPVGGKIDVDAISFARLSMREQRGLTGEHISITPAYILCGPSRETEAEKALAAIYAAHVGDVNPFSGRFTLIVDPRIGTEWYMNASDVDGLEYAYLSGNEGPQVTSENGFSIDGVQFRVRLDFGAGWVDHRGWYKNTGA